MERNDHCPTRVFCDVSEVIGKRRPNRVGGLPGYTPDLDPVENICESIEIRRLRHAFVTTCPSCTKRWTSYSKAMFVTLNNSATSFKQRAWPCNIFGSANHLGLNRPLALAPWTLRFSASTLELAPRKRPSSNMPASSPQMIEVASKSDEACRNGQPHARSSPNIEMRSPATTKPSTVNDRSRLKELSELLQCCRAAALDLDS